MSTPNEPSKTSLLEDSAKAVKLEFDINQTKEVSYVDLLESQIGPQKEPEEPESPYSDMDHSYPVFMQNILERLEKYGQLALTDQIGKHRKRPRKSSSFGGGSEVGDEYYDLDDHFIDDAEIQFQGDKQDFERAEEEGFYTASPCDIQLPKSPKKPTKKKSQKKPAAPEVTYKRKLKVDNLPDEPKNSIFQLKKIYEESKSKRNTTPFPKGANELLYKLGKEAKDNPNLNLEELAEMIGEVCNQKPQTMMRAMEKLVKQNDKNDAQKTFKHAKDSFIKRIASESKSENFSWNEAHKQELEQLFFYLKDLVDLTSEFNQKYLKKSPNEPSLEAKQKELIDQVKKANSKLENIDLLARNLPLSFPKKSVQFERTPSYEEKDFYSSQETH